MEIKDTRTDTAYHELGDLDGGALVEYNFKGDIYVVGKKDSEDCGARTLMSLKDGKLHFNKLTDKVVLLDAKISIKGIIRTEED